MEQDVYSAPKAELDGTENINVPDEILKKIKSAWVAGLISISFTVILTLISMYGTDIMGLDAWAFIDVFLMFIFTFGIYKKSRICAVLMLLFFIANKLIMWQESGAAQGLVMSLIFLWFYLQGVIGTFQYHKHRRANNA